MNLRASFVFCMVFTESTGRDIYVSPRNNGYEIMCKFLALTYPLVQQLPLDEDPTNNTSNRVTYRDRVAVLVEPRRHALLEYAILHTMHHLPRWPLHIFHSDANKRFVHDAISRLVQNGRQVQLTSLNSLGFSNADDDFS
jgi:hypothetical protein